jgi:uncharacterized protein (TIGR03382 family)
MSAATSILQNCYSSGEVSGSNYVGGVVANVMGVKAVVENCVALNPSLTVTNTLFGYVASSTSATVTNCFYLESMDIGEKTPTAGTKGTPESKNTFLGDAFWTGTASWSASVWSFDDGRYPVLYFDGNYEEQKTPKITIINQPTAERIVMADKPAGSLSFGASVSLGVDLTYQWYRNDNASYNDGTKIPGATGNSFIIPTDRPVGIDYYYCVASVPDGTVEKVSDFAKITVIEVAGDGSPGSPLQIGTNDALRAFAECVENAEPSLCADLTAGLEINEWTTIGLNPVNPNYTTDANIIHYAGVFNGNEHTLTLTCADTAKNNIALFRMIDKEGVVKNLKLFVDFEGGSNVAGVAVHNYGRIENIAVDGNIQASSGNSGGIVAYNGRAVTGGMPFISTPEILHCVNKADVRVSGYAGGIAGSFVGKMIGCGNEGDIIGSGGYLGGLIGDVLIADKQEKQPIIISDCYNAGNVSTTSDTSAYIGGLIGWNFGRVSTWGVNYFKISDVFIYGGITQNGSKKNIIGYDNYDGYNQFVVYFNFANTYYLDDIGARLFDAADANGDDGFGTDIVKEVIKSKTAAEFASAEMAALLNNGRTGADAPWEYVAGNDYPTIKATLSDSGPYSGPNPDPYPGSGGGGCDAGVGGMAAMAALGMAMVTRRRSR